MTIKQNALLFLVGLALGAVALRAFEWAVLR